MHPIDDLTREHGPIKLMLRVLEKINDRIYDNEAVATNDLDDAIIFLREFADKCHHGKEEKLLFPIIKKNNFPEEVELADILISEHAQGRNYIKQMAEAIVKKETSQREFAKTFTANAKNYIALLDQHIDKENAVLFPEVKQSLSESQLKELEKGFENVEKNIIGEGRHKELHEIAHKLKEAHLC